MTYTPTTQEVDQARSDGQAAALRTDGSVEDCPHRLLGATDRERTLALARLWLTSFDDARAWMRERRNQA